mmetsp:Transcript_5556/g.8821  ORF Transcript_5556/g.8821 Transcript_5556/m.8821 type:complete len:374 (-) Transcript_5556:520-1641(-)
MRHVPTSAFAVWHVCRRYASRPASVSTSAPGNTSPVTIPRKASWLAICRASRTPSRSVATSSSAVRKPVWISGASKGFAEARDTLPSLFGRQATSWKARPRALDPSRATSVSVAMPSGFSPRAGRNRICRSACASPGRVFTKAPWSQPMQVMGPRPSSAHWAITEGFTRLPSRVNMASVSATGSAMSKYTLAAGWSRRCLPTAGRSTWQGTPFASSSARSPTPDSCSRCGDPTAPAASSTSPPSPSRTAFFTLSCTYSTPTARPSSIWILVMCAPVCVSRFGRFRACLRYDMAVCQRRPLRCCTWNRPKPSCGRDQSLKSSVRPPASPSCSAAARNIRDSGFWYRGSSTSSMPPRPWYAPFMPGSRAFWLLLK